jgi:hypothetical protein
MGAFGADVTSPFVPIGVSPSSPPPRANIAPDKGGSWIKWMLPIVLARKWVFYDRGAQWSTTAGSSSWAATRSSWPGPVGRYADMYSAWIAHLDVDDADGPDDPPDGAAQVVTSGARG